MKYLLILAMVLLHATAWAQEKKIDCDTAWTRVDMEICAAQKYDNVEENLYRVIDSIEKEYASDTLFIIKLKEAQRIWEKLRDAEIDMKYPDFGYYGSVESMCEIIYKGELTNERIVFLRQWLIGEEEGDVCAGSVKIKE